MAGAPADWSDRIEAQGATEGLPKRERRAFHPDGYEPLPEPGPHDWLASHTERGQSFDDYVDSSPHRPNGKRRRIYLQPFGRFAPAGAPRLDALERFARAYFTLDVATLPPLRADEHGIERRMGSSGREQLRSDQILALLRRRLPSDAFCMVGITLFDLYPRPSWSFVFGQASLRHRVGVHSFARYDPRFYGEPFTAGSEHQVLYRSCKVLAHEAGHIFGIEHCVFYRCVMNGSNHLQEADVRPIHLCPVDLRKLCWNTRADVRRRYEDLVRVYDGLGFDEDAEWLRHRLDRIG